MKFVYITCNVSMLEPMILVIDELKITDYQVIEQVTAKSSYAPPRLNTPIWPGYNSSILIQEKEDSTINALIDRVNKMNETAYNKSELIALHTWEITSSATIHNR